MKTDSKCFKKFKLGEFVENVRWKTIEKIISIDESEGRMVVKTIGDDFTIYTDKISYMGECDINELKKVRTS